MRVVLDSNVFISALLLGRNCEEILELARAKVIEILISEEILSDSNEKISGHSHRISRGFPGTNGVNP